MATKAPKILATFNSGTLKQVIAEFSKVSNGDSASLPGVDVVSAVASVNDPSATSGAVVSVTRHGNNILFHNPGEAVDIVVEAYLTGN